ncbi:MAG: hypothetical protein ACUVS4_13290 [Chloroflexaceae bacterium]
MTLPIEWLNFLLSPQAIAAGTLLIFLAGLSEGVGTQGVTLLMTRITPLRFALGLLASALLYVLSAIIWMWALWLAMRALFGAEVPLRLFFVTVSAAYGPLLLGALALLPLVGPAIRWGLRLWSFSIALASIVAITGLTHWQAAAGALVGTLLMEGARWLLSEPAEAIAHRIWALTTGRPHLVRREELPQVIPGYEPVVKGER